MKRYWECWKCGSYIITGGSKPGFSGIKTNLCFAPMPARTSGICGGSFTKEITEDEVKEKERKWKNETKAKH